MNNCGTNTPSLLSVCDVETFYGELQILRKASLDIANAEVVALLGPNGHGKSTLLKAIAGIHPPSAGSIKFRQQEIAGKPSHKIVEMGIAYIPEDRNLFNEMTVLENLNLGAYNRLARKEINENRKLVFSLFPRLLERKHQIVSTLSGGESRMVAIGRGLMSGASLLLIDEPSIGLSPLIKRNVFEAIARVRKETDVSILIVEQEVDYPLKIADRVYLLKNGRIITEKLVQEIDKKEIERAYF